MTATNKVGIQTDINAAIKSGLSNTMAVDVRAVLFEVLDSYVNVKDGGLFYEVETGYSSFLTLTEPKAFVYKYWVEQLVSSSITPPQSFSDVLTESNVMLNGQYIESEDGLKTFQVIDDKIDATFNDGTENRQFTLDSNGTYLTLTGTFGSSIISIATGNEFNHDVANTLTSPQNNVNGNLSSTSNDTLSELKVIDGLVQLTYDNQGITANSTETAITHSTLIKISAQDVFFELETPSKIARFDASGNLKSGTIDESDIATISYVDGIVVGLFDDRGNYDASSNLFPSTGGSGIAGTILKGDVWRISVPGTLGGELVDVGDSIRALADSPAQTSANWATFAANTQQATESIRGTAAIATQAEIEDETTTNDIDITTPKKFWFGFAKGLTLTSFFNAVRGTVLTALSYASYIEIDATDSVLSAFGKLAARIRRLWDYNWSAGAISGFGITDNGNGTANIASGVAMLRTSASSTATLNEYTLSAVTNQAFTDNAVNYILADYNGGTPIITVTTSQAAINTLTTTLIYAVTRVGNSLYYQDTIGASIDTNGKIRRKFLLTERFQYSTGAIISATNRKLALTAGVFVNGVKPLLTAAFNTNVSDTFTYVYYNGTNYTRTTAQTDIDNTNYILAGVSTVMTNNRFRVDYVYLLMSQTPQLWVVQGDTQYSNLAAAKLSTLPTSLPPELVGLGQIVGRVIIEKSATTLADVASNFTTSFVAGSATEHNQLGGLNTGDYLHLTALQYASLNTDRLLSGGAITIGTFGGSGSNNDIRVALGTWQVATVAYATTGNTDFLDITLSAAGNQRYVGLYGTTSNTITKVEGTEAAYATPPSTPANTALLGYVLVGDAVIGAAPTDLTNYYTKNEIIANYRHIVAFKNAASSGVVGTGANEFLRAVLIPANTYGIGDQVVINSKIQRSNGTGTVTNYLYVNTTASLSGATLLGTQTLASSVMLAMQRGLKVTSLTSITTTDPAFSATASDAGTGTAGHTEATVSINQAADYYIISSFNAPNTGTVYNSFMQVERIKAK